MWEVFQDMMEMQELYSDLILELYRNPLNKGRLEGADASYRDVNPVCGDIIEIGMNIQKGKVADIRFQGEGCAISQASASLLTELAKRKKISEVLQFSLNQILQELHLPHLRENPLRIKCAALSLKVMKMALYQYLGKKEEIAWGDLIANDVNFSINNQR